MRESDFTQNDRINDLHFRKGFSFRSEDESKKLTV